MRNCGHGFSNPRKHGRISQSSWIPLPGTFKSLARPDNRSRHSLHYLYHRQPLLPLPFLFRLSTLTIDAVTDHALTSLSNFPLPSLGEVYDEMERLLGLLLSSEEEDGLNLTVDSSLTTLPTSTIGAGYCCFHSTWE
jgi:hypothetical protein